MEDPALAGSGRRRFIITVVVLLTLLVITGLGLRAFIGSDPGREFRERSKAAGEAITAGRYAEARIILTRLVAEHPRRLALRQQLTLCLLRLDRPEEAAVVARGTIEIDPSLAPAHSLLSLALKAAGDDEGAIREARLATTGRKVSGDAHSILAELLIEVGLESEGIETLVAVLEQDRKNEAAALRLATLMTGREIRSSVAWAKARRSLRDQLERFEMRLEENPADPETVIAVARLALAAGEPEVASSHLIAIKVHRELNDDETTLLARALAATGHLDRARALLHGLPAITPAPLPPDQLPPAERPAARKLLWRFEARVMANIEAGSADLALEDLDRLAPEVAETLPMLKLRLVAIWRLAHRDSHPSSLALGDRGEDLEATATAILEKRPLDERSRVTRALALLARGRPDAALADAVHLERHSPSLDDGAWLHGMAALELGFARSAFELLTRARPDAVDSESIRWIVKAAIFAREGEAVLRLAPRMDEIGNGALRSMAALVTGDPDRAEQLAAGESFATSPLSERVQAAGLLCGVGRDAVALAELRLLGTEAAETTGLLRANLLFFLGRGDEASAALGEVADAGGPQALAALLALAERAAVRGVEGHAEYERLIEEIRAHPDGALQALLHEGGMALYRGDPELALLKAGEVLARMEANAPARALRLESLLDGQATAEKIEAAADEVLEVTPGFAPARRVRALALVREGRENLLSGNADAATAQLSEAMSLAPGVAGARLLRGMALLGGGDLSAAEEDAELLKSSEETRFAGRFLEGMVRLNRGDPEAAVESYRSALELEPDSMDAVTALGVALLRAGRIEEALLLTDRLATLESGKLRSLKIRAFAQAARDDYGAAEQSLREALARDETDLGARLLLSRVLVAGRKKAEGVEVLRQAIATHPGTPAPHLQLVRLLLALKDPEGAMAAADAAGSIAGLQALSHILRFHCLREAGEKAGSIEELEAALRIEPENPIALEYLGEATLELGDAGAGRGFLAQAASASPRNLRVLMRLGVLAQMAGQNAEAEKWYERLLFQNPGFSPAVNNLAFLLAADPGTAARAVELAERAVSIDRTNGEYHDTLATALSAAGRHDEAVAAAREALRLLPKNAMIAVRSAETLRDAGRTEEARVLAEKAATVATPEEKDTVDREVRELLISLAGR
jgi:tetratricopeptide (TPR) repeat protein